MASRATELLGSFAAGCCCVCCSALGLDAFDGTDSTHLVAGEAVQPSVTAECSALGSARSALSVAERALVGSPTEYTPDLTLASRIGELARSQRLRRQAAWRIAERVLAPAALEAAVPLAPATLPAWQTWHDKEDLTRIFRHLFPTLDADDRRDRRRFSSRAIADAARWNDDAIDDYETWTVERWNAYRAAIDEHSKLAGVAGIHRVSYAPATSRHLIGSYPELLTCGPETATPVSSSAPSSACSPGAALRPACLQSSFPTSATLVKADWRRAGLDTPLPTYDTSRAGLERRMGPLGSHSWTDADGSAEPTSDRIYTLQLANGNRYQLVALHIMTKELNHWFWVTLWWSPDPDRDFGADRPDTLPAPFQNYKLCSVVDFVEGDPDPDGGFTRDAPSLAHALAVTHRGEGGPSWCANPYLERGDRNAMTNCIGCHQHAGTGLNLTDILADEQAFPEFGRVRVRNASAADYVFDTIAGDNLRAVIEETVDHFAPAD